MAESLKDVERFCSNLRNTNGYNWSSTELYDFIVKFKFKPTRNLLQITKPYTLFSEEIHNVIRELTYKSLNEGYKRCFCVLLNPKLMNREIIEEVAKLLFEIIRDINGNEVVEKWMYDIASCLFEPGACEEGGFYNNEDYSWIKNLYGSDGWDVEKFYKENLKKLVELKMNNVRFKVELFKRFIVLKKNHTIVDVSELVNIYILDNSVFSYILEEGEIFKDFIIYCVTKGFVSCNKQNVRERLCLLYKSENKNFGSQIVLRFLYKYCDLLESEYYTRDADNVNYIRTCTDFIRFLHNLIDKDKFNLFEEAYKVVFSTEYTCTKYVFIISLFTCDSSEMLNPIETKFISSIIDLVRDILVILSFKYVVTHINMLAYSERERIDLLKKYFNLKEMIIFCEDSDDRLGSSLKILLDKLYGDDDESIKSKLELIFRLLNEYRFDFGAYYRNFTKLSPIIREQSFEILYKMTDYLFIDAKPFVSDFEEILDENSVSEKLINDFGAILLKQNSQIHCPIKGDIEKCFLKLSQRLDTYSFLYTCHKNIITQVDNPDFMFEKFDSIKLMSIYFNTSICRNTSKCYTEYFEICNKEELLLLNQCIITEVYMYKDPKKLKFLLQKGMQHIDENFIVLLKLFIFDIQKMLDKDFINDIITCVIAYIDKIRSDYLLYFVCDIFISLSHIVSQEVVEDIHSKLKGFPRMYFTSFFLKFPNSYREHYFDSNDEKCILYKTKDNDRILKIMDNSVRALSGFSSRIYSFRSLPYTINTNSLNKEVSSSHLSFSSKQNQLNEKFSSFIESKFSTKYDNNPDVRSKGFPSSDKIVRQNLEPFIPNDGHGFISSILHFHEPHPDKVLSKVDDGGVYNDLKEKLISVQNYSNVFYRDNTFRIKEIKIGLIIKQRKTDDYYQKFIKNIGVSVDDMESCRIYQDNTYRIRYEEFNSSAQYFGFIIWTDSFDDLKESSENYVDYLYELKHKTDQVIIVSSINYKELYQVLVLKAGKEPFCFVCNFKSLPVSILYLIMLSFIPKCIDEK